MKNKSDMRCKICDNSMEMLFSDGEDYFLHQSEELFGVAYCEKCKIGYGVPLISGTELSQYYPSHYEAYVVKKGPLDLIQRMKYSSDLRIILSYAKKKNISLINVYEIGAGRGEFLDALQKNKFFCEAKIRGTEISKDGCTVAKKQFDIDLDNTDAENLIFEQRYSLIVMRHVLEHFNRFNEVLSNIYNNGMLDDGMIFIKVPCMDSYDADKYGKYWQGYDMPRHRIMFTENGLKELLKKIGFKDVVCIREVVPSSHDDTVQFKKRGRVYRNSKYKWIRFCLYQPLLMLRKTKADRIIVMAHK